MDHIAIDLGGRESQICVRSQDGSIIDERRCATGTLSRYLQRRPAGRVVVETCAEAFSVADEAVAAGHEVKVVPATLVRVLGVGSRGVKTDRRDAQILSEVSCRIELPSVHVPAAITRDRRSQCTSRENLVQTRTSLINGARGWLRQQRVRIRSGTTQTFPKRVREKLLKSEAGLPAYIERMLVSIETLSEQIRAADGELQQLAREDSACERLMSVPGVGPVTAVRFVSALENVERFGGAHAVEASGPKHLNLQ
jgi:transposase